MFFLLLPFLVLSADNDFPKISYFLVNSGFSKNEMERINNWIKYKDNMLKTCESRYRNDKIKQCKSFINSITSIVCSNGKDVNDKLTKISKKTEFLFYLIQTKHSKVDFNSLKTKMAVFMLPHHFSSHKSANGDSILQSLFDLNMNIFNSSFDGKFEDSLMKSFANNKNNGNKFTEVEINGNINEKVSFLTISQLKIIYSNDFRCENLYITNAILSTSSNSYVRVNNFIVDVNSYTNYSISKIDVNRFSLLDFNTKNSNLPHYRIVYLNKSYGIQYKYDNKFNNSNKYNWIVNYSITKEFTLICHSFHIVIEAGPFVLNKYSDINVTIIDKKLQDSSFLAPSTLSSNEILIESKGFDTISPSKWPSIDVTYDKSKYLLDTTNLDLDVKEHSLFTYKPRNFNVKVGVIIGIVGIVVLVVIIIIITVIIKRKKKSNNLYNNNTNTTYEKTLLNNNDQDNINGKEDVYQQNYYEPAQPTLQTGENYYYQTPPYAPPPPEVVYPSNNSNINIW